MWVCLVGGWGLYEPSCIEQRNFFDEFVNLKFTMELYTQTLGPAMIRLLHCTMIIANILPVTITLHYADTE